MAELSPDLAAEVLFASDRTCCVCRERGKPVQIHHVDDDHQNNERRNLAVLCVMCHIETQTRGGFVRRLDAAQVLVHREDWDARVRRRRDDADRIHAEVMSAIPREENQAGALEVSVAEGFGVAELALGAVGVGHAGTQPSVPIRDYIWALPALRRRAYDTVTDFWAREGSDHVVDVLQDALVGLASYYPSWSFSEQNAREMIADQIASRYRWHRFHHETEAIRAATIVNNLIGASVVADAVRMVEEVVASILDDWGEDEFSEWKREWDQLENTRTV